MREECFQAVGHQGPIAWALNNLGLVADDWGAYARAAAVRGAGLTIRTRLEARRDVAASREGRAAQAMQLLAAALREARGPPMPPIAQAPLQAMITALRATRGAMLYRPMGRGMYPEWG